MIYTNTPQVALSQPDATHIDLAAVRVDFASKTLSLPGLIIPGTLEYNARTITISDTGDVPTWLYVTISDPDYLGDDGSATALEVFAEPTHDKVGEPGFIYLGALQAGGANPALPGGWPAPQLIFAEVP